jgi:hypothetical protein
MSGFQTGRGVAPALLHPAVAQAGDGAAVGAVDLHREQVVAAHADGPGAVELADDAVLAVRRWRRRSRRRCLVFFAALIHALRDVRGAQAGDGLDVAEEVVDHVAPVAEHVDDDAAAVLLAVVPGRALAG